MCETGRHFHLVSSSINPISTIITISSYMFSSTQQIQFHPPPIDYYRKIMSTNNTCANCEKCEESSGDLKACTACKMVKYCHRDCQIAHRPQHKKACKKRAAELHDEKLFEEPPPPEECPICMLPPPLYDNLYTGMTFRSCCGKNICDGCEYAMDESEAKGLFAHSVRHRQQILMKRRSRE